MVKRVLILISFSFLFSSVSFSGPIEENRNIAAGNKNLDSVLGVLEANLSLNSDSILQVVDSCKKVCDSLHYEIGDARVYYIIGKSRIIGAFNFPEAFDNIYKALRIFDKYNLTNERAKCNVQLGLINYIQRNFTEAAGYFTNAQAIFKSTGDTMRWRRSSYLYSLCASELRQFDKADEALKLAERLIKYGPDDAGFREYYYGRGIYYSRRALNDSAIACFLTVATKFDQAGDQIGQQLFNAEIAQAYFNKGDFKSAELYSGKVLKAGYLHNSARGIVQAHFLLYRILSLRGDYKDALSHLSDYITLRDSMQDEKKSFELASIKSKYELEKADQENRLKMAQQAAIQNEQLQKQTSLKNLFITGCIFFVILIIFLFYNNRLRKQKNAQLAESLEKLKTTQEQLIRHEKLASMGKLSAGIAHEIRNPINFIMNFSELSEEYVDELLEANSDEDRLALLNLIRDSMQKIREHGQRADGIVKNMLDHSRSNTPEKSKQKINQLLEDNLSMSINAIRVQDPDFMCGIERHFDSTLPPLFIVGADIGRVFLNIFNNAFHAMGARKKESGADYTPKLTIQTSKDKSSILIRIHDNGPGIPEKIKDHIFEPFFTTKPAGQGTGLGLSISNEIIRAHGGELSVESGANNGTTFVIRMPF